MLGQGWIGDKASGRDCPGNQGIHPYSEPAERLGQLFHHIANAAFDVL